jgi:O-antigen ligase/polysaccharide polymerase Wzy-like membrane protein
VLAAALAAVLWRTRALPLATAADRLALAYGAVVVLYALIPQDWLGGDAGTKAVLQGLRHDLVPVAAYVLGRGLARSARDERRVRLVVVGTAAVVAAFGLVEVYAVPLQWWRDSGAPGWFREQLGLRYEGLSGLPENFVYNPGGDRPLRRLVSTFLSPLATAYLLVVALLLLQVRERGRWVAPASALLFAGLLWTHTRAAILALAVGLAVLALGLRRPALVATAIVTVAVGVAFVRVYEDIGPKTRFTATELEFQHRQAQRNPSASGDPFSAGESSTASHWRNLRAGIETVARHPQGYGLGNSGVTAFRSGVTPKAGESTYTELGVDAGLVGALLFIAWSLALLRLLVPRDPWLAAAFAAVLALAVQTDVIGVHWLAYVLWALAGWAASPTAPERAPQLRLAT